MSKEKHSPMPWSRCYTRILDADGLTVCVCQRDLVHGMDDDETAKADAALIVEAVNGRVNLLNALSEEQERGYLLEEERTRLRDLVRRMLPGVEKAYAIAQRMGKSIAGTCALNGVDASEVDNVLAQWAGLLAEAREAIGEGSR